jgi:uncharacterized membrane protein
MADHRSREKMEKPSKLRTGSLDMLRAAAILLFIFYHVLVTMVPEGRIPFFLRYNQGPILLFGDLIAPAFSFILGAALFFSYSNSENRGWNFFMRKFLSFAGILALGLFLDSLSCGIGSWPCPKWGVLQWLGAGGMIALLLVRFPLAVRILAFVLLLAAYAQRSSVIPAAPFQWGDWPYAASTAWGYGIISIFGSIAAEMHSRRKIRLAILSAAVLLAGIYFSQAIPIDKVQGSLTFVMTSAAISGILWCLLSGFDRGIPSLVSFISRNSLVLWVLQYVLMWEPMAVFGLWGRISLGFSEGMLISLAALPVFVGAAHFWVQKALPRLEEWAGKKEG